MCVDMHLALISILAQLVTTTGGIQGHTDVFRVYCWGIQVGHTFWTRPSKLFVRRINNIINKKGPVCMGHEYLSQRVASSLNSY